jgi:hypothetical protein
VVEIGLPLRRGKSLQCCAKPLESFEHGELREIGKSHADVVGVMKRSAWHSALFEFFYDFFVSHGF